MPAETRGKPGTGSCEFIVKSVKLASLSPVLSMWDFGQNQFIHSFQFPISSA